MWAARAAGTPGPPRSRPPRPSTAALALGATTTINLYYSAMFRVYDKLYEDVKNFIVNYIKLNKNEKRNSSGRFCKCFVEKSKKPILLGICCGVRQ